jgi:SAM-dependent methyltransferase
MTDAAETFEISADQAEIYETRFVPAIFAEWAGPLLDAASVRSGQSVLDVACGTGVLARAAAARVGPTGRVVGLDRGEGMLTVARRLRPDLEWRQGDAAELPFPDGTFDAVLCQSALMFFPDATGALREMGRVCVRGGTVGVQVFSSADAQPGYGPWIEMVAQWAGPEAISLLSTYWVHGDLDVLSRRFETAGLEVTDIHTRVGTARFSSIEDMVLTEIASTPLADRITDEVERRILAESEEVLGRFRSDSGVEVPLAGHLVIALKR